MPSYAELQAKYKDGIPCPPTFNFTDVIARWGQSDPALLALHWVSADFLHERKVTYAELDALSHRAAIGLSRLGIKRGDRVMVQLPRVVEWWVVIFGCMRLGAVPVPGTTLLVAADLKYRASSCKAKAFIGCHAALAQFDKVASAVGVSTLVQVRVQDDAGLLPGGKVDFQAMVASIPAGAKYTPPVAPRSTDLACIYFTSGTTGKAKQVLLEQEWTLGHTSSGWWYDITPGVIFANMADWVGQGGLQHVRDSQ